MNTGLKEIEWLQHVRGSMFCASRFMELISNACTTKSTARKHGSDFDLTKHGRHIIPNLTHSAYPKINSIKSSPAVCTISRCHCIELYWKIFNCNVNSANGWHVPCYWFGFTMELKHVFCGIDFHFEVLLLIRPIELCVPHEI